MDDSKPPPSLTRNFSDVGLSLKTPMEKVQAWLQLAHHPGFDYFDRDLLQQMKVVSATEGKVVFEFTVTKQMCNAAGTIHGGCAATILDDLTTMPAYTIAKPGFLDGGSMSRTLSCTYLRPIKAGEKVKVVCEVVAAGKTLCHFRGDMILEDGRVAISCVHDKVPRHKARL